AVEAVLRVMFQEGEVSRWPADYAWKAVESAKLEEAAYQKACERLGQGTRPTLGALSILASYAVARGKAEKRVLQPYWRTWLPDRGARELVKLQKMVDAADWPKERYRACLMKELSDAACALLGDEKGLLETWNEYRNYFNGQLEKAEWFEPRRRYLLADLVILARSMEENNRKMYKKMLRSLWWKRAAEKLRFTNTTKTS